MAGAVDEYMTDRGGRDSRHTFGYALLASIAAHSLLMFGLSSLRAGEAKFAAPSRLLARLVEERPKAPGFPLTPPRYAVPPRVDAVPALMPRETIPPVEASPVALATPAPGTVAVTSPSSSAPPAAQAPSPPAEPPASEVATLAEITASAPVAAPEPLDPVSVSRYRVAVMGTANRYKRYPRIAMENNWQGRVEVTMRVRANGSIASLDIKRSAGYEALDHQALNMIREANSRTPLPETLRGREFSIDIPIVFSLRDPST